MSVKSAGDVVVEKRHGRMDRTAVRHAHTRIGSHHQSLIGVGDGVGGVGGGVGCGATHAAAGVKGGGCALIKSASTSTCCARENASFQPTYQHLFKAHHQQAMPSMSSFCLSPSTNLVYRGDVSSHRAFKFAAARPTTTSSTGPAEHISSVKLDQFRLASQPKHFSDFSLDQIGLPTCFSKSTIRRPPQVVYATPQSHFSSHPKLDNLLIAATAGPDMSTHKNGAKSILNFATIDDLQCTHRSNTNPTSVSTIVSVSESSCEGDGGARSRKTSVFENGENFVRGDNDEKISGVDCDETIEDVSPTSCRKIDQSPAVHRADVSEEKPKEMVVAAVSCETDKKCDGAGQDGSEKARFRRTSSLKMPKEGNSTLAEKKIVRFADALGLDLIDVRTFLDELPSVPKAAYCDLMRSDDEDNGAAAALLQLSSSPPLLAETDGGSGGGDSADCYRCCSAIANTHIRAKTTKSDSSSRCCCCSNRLASYSTTLPITPFTAETKTLVPMFKQPHTSLNFLDRVRDNCVSLEYAKVCPTPVCSINGMVRVRNLDFCKSVFIRYSVDNWRSFNELQAAYVADSCDGFSDKFAFVAYIYDVKVNQRIEMAIRFHCSGSIFWDSNNGSNYVFQCLPSAPVVPSYFQYVTPAINDSCNSFY